MATKTGSQSMDPNVRWDRREEEKKKEQAPNSVRKGKARRALARPAGGPSAREAYKHSHEPAKRRPIESEANGGQI